MSIIIYDWVDSVYNHAKLHIDTGCIWGIGRNKYFMSMSANLDIRKHVSDGDFYDSTVINNNIE